MAPTPKIWLKRVLIPFFVVDIISTAIILAGGIVALIGLAQLSDGQLEIYDPDYTDAQYDQARHILAIAAGVLIGICSLTLVLDLTAIILWACHRLTPAIQVTFTSIKTLIWLVIFILNIFSFVQTGFAFIWSIVLFASSLGQLIYCSIILHRHRTDNFSNRGAYTPAPMPVGAPGFANTAYNPAHPVPNPFRNPSPAPAGGMEPLRAPPTEYYSPDAVAAASRREEYAMQQTGYRSQV